MGKRNIVIIGLGGVGGYFGFKINQANEGDRQNHIAFVGRGETYEAVNKNGLKLISPEHLTSVTKPDAIYEMVSAINDPDLIFICVKEYDLETVCVALQKVITPKTILFPLMNGVDIYERIRQIIPHNIILPSCVYVASHIKEKGVVEHKGNAGKLIFGRDPQHFSADIEWVEQLLHKCKINYECKDSALVDIWTKFIFIASFGLVTAKHNSSIGTVCDDEAQRGEARRIMQEIKRIAYKKGVELSDTIVDETFKKAATFPPDTPTSLQLDINSGKGKSELELFAGAILKNGAALKLESPNAQEVYNDLASRMKDLNN